MVQVEDFDADRMAGMVELIGRTGAMNFKLQYCEEESPVVWAALAEYGGKWRVAAGLNPITAVIDLVEKALDGGKCLHCDRMTGFVYDFKAGMPLDDVVCWYQWDPELKKYRRGCEGEERAESK